MIPLPNALPGQQESRHAATALRATRGFENARRCVHDDRAPLPPAPRALPPGDCRISAPPRARSCYHPLPARSNWPRRGPSRGFGRPRKPNRSEEHTSELQSHLNLVCRLLLEKKKKNKIIQTKHYARKNIGYLVANNNEHELLIAPDQDNMQPPRFEQVQQYMTKAYLSLKRRRLN